VSLVFGNRYNVHATVVKASEANQSKAVCGQACESDRFDHDYAKNENIALDHATIESDVDNDIEQDKTNASSGDNEAKFLF